MARGVRAWQDPDLFSGAPPAQIAPETPPAPAAAPAEGAPRRRYTDRENRRLEKVLEVFKAWLDASSIDQLRAAAMPKLLIRFAPMQDWDIAQMIEVRIARLERKR